MTNEECIEYFKNYLKDKKVKEINIEEDDLILYKIKGVTYSINIEDFETVHYGVYAIEGVDIGDNFWIYKDEYGDYEYIDEFYGHIVEENSYLYVKKIWQTLTKIIETYDDEGIEIIKKFIGVD